MRIEFLEAAERELARAISWYESKEAGLGERLRKELARILSLIKADPYIGEFTGPDTAE